VKYTLRDYKPEDFGALYKIDRVCYPADIAYSKRALRAYLQMSGAECVVAEAANAIAGFCVSAYQNTRGYIVTIDVLDQFRRIGMGSALLCEVEQRLAANGAQEIGLETATDNESAIAFWRKRGYRTSGIRKGYYPGGRDAFSMRKTIASPAIKSKESG
jgi:[ribosomal protein S18]-alanine N-acetyltransferase